MMFEYILAGGLAVFLLVVCVGSGGAILASQPRRERAATPKKNPVHTAANCRISDTH